MGYVGMLVTSSEAPQPHSAGEPSRDPGKQLSHVGQQPKRRECSPAGLGTAAPVSASRASLPPRRPQPPAQGMHLFHSLCPSGGHSSRMTTKIGTLLPPPSRQPWQAAGKRPPPLRGRDMAVMCEGMLAAPVARHRAPLLGQNPRLQHSEPKDSPEGDGGGGTSTELLERGPTGKQTSGGQHKDAIPSPCFVPPPGALMPGTAALQAMPLSAHCPGPLSRSLPPPPRLPFACSQAGQGLPKRRCRNLGPWLSE